MADHVEVWKPINSNGSLKFEVSNFGNVRRLAGKCKAGRNYNAYFISTWPDPRGYMCCKIGDKTHKVHRLVALAFIPNPEGYETVNHKDGNKQNNRVENLEWMSLMDNVKHAHESGLLGRYKRVGEQVGTSRYNADFVTRLRSEYIESDMGFREIAQKFNINRVTAIQMINLKTWKHIPLPIDEKEYQARLKDKIRQTRSKGQYERLYPSVGPKGSNHGSAKLWDDDIKQIRASFISGELNTIQLAEKYNVTLSNITYIIDLLSWTHVPIEMDRQSYLELVKQRKKEIKSKAMTKASRSNGRCRLTIEQAIQIRNRILGGEKQNVLAKEFGVSSTVISGIHKNKTYLT